jgi:hypothetical protein
MFFDFYTNAISRASKNAAGGIFAAGLFLVGIGVLIAAMPELVGYLVAGVFVFAGFGCVVIAIKIYWQIRKLGRSEPDPTQEYRKNVQIHIENHSDF